MKLKGRPDVDEVKYKKSSVETDSLIFVVDISRLFTILVDKIKGVCLNVFIIHLNTIKNFLFRFYVCPFSYQYET